MARIGETKCWNPRCGCTDAPVHRTSGGRLSIKCHKCQGEAWLPIGTKAHRDGTELTKLDEGGTPPSGTPSGTPSARGSAPSTPPTPATPTPRRMTLLG